MPGFLEALAQRVLVCDGAMGTMLYERGVFLNRSFDELNLTEPAVVAAIHRDYLDAGADVIETNTFGANRFKLVNFGLADEVARINEAGARLAREAAGGRGWIAGAMGPLGVRIAPWGRTTEEAAIEAFREQAVALAAGGVDLFLLETFGDVTELAAAIRAVRSAAPLPVVAQLTTGEDGHTLDGTPPERFMEELVRAGADVVGVNCSVGPAAMLETIEQMARVSAVPLAAQPNAGQPREIDGRHLYLSSPDYMASYARRFVAAGVRLVGGCCGTTPDHTREIARAVRASATSVRAASPPAVDATRAATSHAAVPSAPLGTRPSGALGAAVPAPADERRTGLARALADGRPVTLAEVAAPRGLDAAGAAAAAHRYRALGADVVSVPDYALSGARASAVAIALYVERGHVETLLHYACRDRTLLGMQADLVGAHALGLRNVLATTGAATRVGGYQDASSAFEVDSIGLITLMARLNQGLDIAGQPIGAPASFHIGAAVNPFAADPDREWRRLAQKVEAGAQFLVTPPIIDVDAFEAVLDRLSSAGLPIVAGVAALDDARHAEFLANEVPGVRVPAALMREIASSADEPAAALKISIAIAARLRQNVQGLLITSFHGSSQTTERLLAALGGPAHA
jgi:homocysteine S-methyltransferase